MGACASKPKVLEGTAPHVAGEDIMKNKKQEGIVGDDVPNKPHSLSNLLKEGKSSEEQKEETSETIQAQPNILPKTEEIPPVYLENATEDAIKSKIDERVEEIKSTKEVIKLETETTPAQKEEVIKSETDKRVDEIKSETEITTPAQKKEVIKSEIQTTAEEVITSETEIFTKKKVEETVETPAEEGTQAEKKTQEEKYEAPVEEKPAKKPIIEEKKSGNFWWDK